MTKALETEKVYESPQLSETQLFHASRPSPRGELVVMNHVWKNAAPSHRWSGVSETRRDSVLTSTWW